MKIEINDDVKEVDIGEVTQENRDNGEFDKAVAEWVGRGYSVYTAEDGEEWGVCHSCEEVLPKSELRDTNYGDTCDWCVEGLMSHGVHLTINYNN